MTTKIDFTKVDMLRRHMLMTISNMAQILKVSRQTYYNWVSGSSYPAAAKEAKVKGTIRKLFGIINDYQWPYPEIIASPQKQRFETLVALLEGNE